MASVTSLDKDLLAVRRDKYTPARANEVRSWIEDVLAIQITSDLLEALKDGTILCKLVNTASGPGTVRFKESSMPFVQMENISHFLRVCQASPFNLPAHDTFLTVDLYESKDPSQVLQCLEAFSRKANALYPERIPTAIGGRKAVGLTPDHSTSAAREAHSLSPQHAREFSSNSIGSATSSGRSSPTKSAAPGPAWNYAQYGWMGGASQGNQGVAFGSRRQITSPAPSVPSLAEKERKRREIEAEEERRQHELALLESKRQSEAKIHEQERIVAAEKRRAEEELRHREDERKQVEAEKKRWEEEERKWREEEDRRSKEETAEATRLEEDRRRRRANSNTQLKGQLLSQYQAEQTQMTAEKSRIAELERQLAEAKAREQDYENERKKLVDHHEPNAMPATEQPASKEPAQAPNEQAWNDSEHDYAPADWERTQDPSSPRPLPTPQTTSALPIRPLPVPTAAQTEQPARPLPVPIFHTPAAPTPNRTDQFLAKNPAPVIPSATKHIPSEASFNSTAESDAEAQRRIASQKATKAGGWAGKSLLEREMERERERQQEWETAQKETQGAVANGVRDPNAGTGPGQSWDIHSYGYTGGDNLNKGSSGVFSGRRQLVGPRPLEKK